MRAWLIAVLVWWVMLLAVVVAGGRDLSQAWPGWPWAAAAAAVWGLNVVLVFHGVGYPLQISRPPVLAAGFALLMTLIGSGSYWATIQLYPWYRVGIERAAWLVAVCSAVALGVAAVAARVRKERDHSQTHRLEWDWPRLRAATLCVFAIAAVGTAITMRRLGYVPILTGDPTSARVDFPVIGGIWYRLSMLGGVAALLVAAQAAARRATPLQYAVGVASLVLVGLYGPRFFVALPVGVALLLWDRVRAPVRFGRVGLLVMLGLPLLTLVGYWRGRDLGVALLGPIGLLLYGSLGEFRDLGWALEYYEYGDRFRHGETLGSFVVPLLPAPVWHLVGIDKAAIYAQSSANILADAMGQTTGQRIGAYGEFFMNFGWTGAIVGAALYGLFLEWLDDRYGRVEARHVRALVLALTITVTVFAQVGQLNMFTSTLTGFGYPLALVAAIAARRAVA